VGKEQGLKVFEIIVYDKGISQKKSTGKMVSLDKIWNIKGTTTFTVTFLKKQNSICFSLNSW
jgi:hypothetical protein